MKYKFNIYKQVTTLSKLTATCTANSYTEAVDKFNNNLDKIEAAPNFKEVESCTVYCVDDIVTLKLQFYHRCHDDYLPPEYFDNPDLLHKLIDLIFEYVINNPNPEEDVWDSIVDYNEKLFHVNICVYEEGVYTCTLYDVDRESNICRYDLFYPFEVLIKKNKKGSA
jgi:hypothetical protein